ncbi:MAG: class II aldolase/adducin family protein [Bacteroidota bacterium]
MKITHDIGRVCRHLVARGWVEASAGNLSYLMDETEHMECRGTWYQMGFKLDKLKGRQVLVSGSGTRMREMQYEPEDSLVIVFISGDGRRYASQPLKKESKGLKPTSELFMHLHIHDRLLKDNSPDRVVLHAHITDFIVLSHREPELHSELLTTKLRNIHPEMDLLIPEGAGVVSFLSSGSLNLAREAAEVLSNYPAALMMKHGGIATGTDFAIAMDRLELINKLVSIFLRLR